ncbi:MAG: hypothetical protein EXR59_04870 [Dehalococcoidia bacterium]|nr:hypothetical protein [Dehalococcoidia bacterium]
MNARTPHYQTPASSISALAVFWEARLADNSLRMKLGLDDDQWKADDKNDAEPMSVSLLRTLVVKEGKDVRDLTDSEVLLLKTALSPFTPFAESWLSIDLKLLAFISAATLFDSFLADICGQFKAKADELAKINDWNGWKEQLFKYGILTVNTLGSGIDEKLSFIFTVKNSIGKSDKDPIQLTEESVTETLRTINEMTTLIVRSSGWKLMTRMQP